MGTTMQKSTKWKTLGSKPSTRGDFSSATSVLVPVSWRISAIRSWHSCCPVIWQMVGFTGGNNVKHVLIGIGALALVVSMASPAQAILITSGDMIGVDVGGEDWLVDSIAKDPLKDLCGNGSNPTVELCWANSVKRGFLGHGLRENPSVRSRDVVQAEGSARTEGARRATGVRAEAVERQPEARRGVAATAWRIAGGAVP